MQRSTCASSQRQPCGRQRAAKHRQLLRALPAVHGLQCNCATTAMVRFRHRWIRGLAELEPSGLLMKQHEARQLVRFSKLAAPETEAVSVGFPETWILHRALPESLDRNWGAVTALFYGAPCSRHHADAPSQLWVRAWQNRGPHSTHKQPLGWGADLSLILRQQIRYKSGFGLHSNCFPMLACCAQRRLPEDCDNEAQLHEGHLQLPHGRHTLSADGMCVP